MRKVLMASIIGAASLWGANANAQFCPGPNGVVFEDVPVGDPFCPAVTWIANRGITLGCATIDGNRKLYCPTDDTNRMQMALFLQRLGEFLFPPNCPAGSVMKFDGTDWECADETAGPPGPQGPAGPAGPEGPAGAAGAAGPAGPEGPAGAQGAQGIQGAQGPQGPAGADGASGLPGTDGRTVLSAAAPPAAEDGVDGDFFIDTAAWMIYGPKTAGAWGAGSSLVGPAGAAGAAGEAGPAGPAGPQGEAGPAGAAGATGPQGPQGPAGADGPQGPAGPIGATGAQGIPGVQGPQGPAGADGAPGLPGADGRTVLSGATPPAPGIGSDGDFFIDTAAWMIYGPKTAGAWGAGSSMVGPSGAAGEAGPTGPAGPQGETGPAGAQGETGPAGAAGATGPQGPIGPIGPQGLQGPIGQTGPAGAGGAQGPAGPTGNTGPAGPQGPAGPAGGFSTNAPIYNAANTSYTVTATDFTILCAPSGSAKTITLPAPAAGNVGRIYIVKRTGGGQLCNVSRNGGGSTINLGSGDSVMLQSDGSTWWPVAHY